MCVCVVMALTRNDSFGRAAEVGGKQRCETGAQRLLKRRRLRPELNASVSVT
jgi:hypothetical protein